MKTNLIKSLNKVNQYTFDARP